MGVETLFYAQRHLITLFSMSRTRITHGLRGSSSSCGDAAVSTRSARAEHVHRVVLVEADLAGKAVTGTSNALLEAAVACDCAGRERYTVITKLPCSTHRSNELSLIPNCSFRAHGFSEGIGSEKNIRKSFVLNYFSQTHLTV